MDHHQIARLLAAGRLITGILLVVAPRRLGRRWIGEAGGRRATATITRAMGARDAALAAGTLRALQRGEPARPWILGAAACDAVDAVATLAGAGDGRSGRRRAAPIVLLATASVIGGTVAARGLDER